MGIDMCDNMLSWEKYYIKIIIRMDILTSPINWTGGKKRVVPHILKYAPKTFNNYFEPFIGSGVVLLNLFDETKFDDKILIVISPVFEGE